MDTSSIATLTGKHKNEEAEKSQQPEEVDESTAVLERKAPEWIPEMICIKQEPPDVYLKEEMALENEETEDPVLTNRIKRRWHEFGLEIPQPLPYSKVSVKEEAPDETAPILNVSVSLSEGENEASNNGRNTKETFQDSSVMQSSMHIRQQDSSERPALCLSRKRLSEIIKQKMKPLPPSVEDKKVSGKSDQIPNVVVDPSVIKTKILDILRTSTSEGSRINDKNAENLAKEILNDDSQLSQNTFSYKMLGRINEILESRSFRFRNLSEEQRKANEKAGELTRLWQRGYRAARLARETPEAMKHRLQLKRLDAALQRARETPEAREMHLYMRRLQAKRLYAAKRRARETPEAREKRLCMLRERRERLKTRLK